MKVREFASIACLLAVFTSLFITGCNQVPFIKFQDQREGKDAPIYLSRDPRKNSNQPVAPAEEEMRPKR